LPAYATGHRNRDGADQNGAREWPGRAGTMALPPYSASEPGRGLPGCYRRSRYRDVLDRGAAREWPGPVGITALPPQNCRYLAGVSPNWLEWCPFQDALDRGAACEWPEHVDRLALPVYTTYVRERRYLRGRASPPPLAVGDAGAESTHRTPLPVPGSADT